MSAGAETGACPRRARRPRPLAVLGALVGVAALAVAGGFLWFVQQSVRTWPEPPPTPGIAVLTGGPDRVEAGLVLLARRPEARLLISGVGRESTLPDLVRESGAAEAGLESAALFPRVRLGHDATSTRGNAREVAAWARDSGLREITVVTAGFHMPRALLELRRSLPGAVLHPLPVAPFAARPLPMLREYVKLVGALFGLSTLTERPRPDVPGRPPR